MGSGIHWLAPASAIGGLVAAVFFTVGHHLFYQSVHGSPVSEKAFFGFEVSQQQANIAIGTAFAFLAKASLVFAISVAFVQLFWHAVSARRRKSAPTVERVDALHSTVENAFEMFNFKSWWSHPLLMLVAGLTWLVPIAAILTPATLSIKTAEALPFPSAEARVPSLDFRNLNFLAPMPHTELPAVTGQSDPTPWFYSYAGPSDEVLRVANVATMQDTIMPITHPGVNASWELDFYGPSLQCSEVDRTIADDFGHRFNKLVNLNWSRRQNGYVVWFPRGPANDSDSIELPIRGNWTIGNISSLDIGSVVAPPTYETLNRTKEPLDMFVLTKPFQLSDLLSFTNENNDGLEILHCQLHNATYHVSFDYSSGDQQIALDVGTSSPEDAINGIPGVLYKVQNQMTDYWEYPCRSDHAHELLCCYNQPQLLQTLSYQAMMEAFSRNLRGSVYLYRTKDSVTTAFGTDSNVMQTTLARAKNLAFLTAAKSMANVSSYAATFQSEVKGNQSGIAADLNGAKVDFRGAYTDLGERPVLNMDVKEIIEKMFQNFTISLMSSAALQPNSSSPTAPETVKVTYHRYHNIYVYSPRKLWLPYGIALGVSTLAVLAGLVTMFLNRASYSSSFSTVLRAAHGAQLSAELMDEDSRGQDPLPKYLAEAQIWLRGVKTNGASSLLSQREGPPPVPPKEARSTVKLLGGDGEAGDGGRRSL